MPRVALTTSADRAPDLAAIAVAHGLQPVTLPCIEVVPAPGAVLEAARRSVAEADWLMVTSARTVGCLWPQGGLPGIEVAAVGPRTAAAVARAGGEVTLLGGFDGASMISELSELVEGKYVSFPHGRGSDLTKVSVLERAARSVSTWEVYSARPIPPALNPVEAVAFGSPSSVEGWFQSRGLQDIVVGAIGDTTGAALSEHGQHAYVVPERPDYAELLERLSAKVRERDEV
jgi:uroporphyrinogen-III synthase